MKIRSVWKSLAVALVLAVLGLAVFNWGVALPARAQSTGPGAPETSGTVVGISRLALYTEVLSGTGTVYSTRDIGAGAYHHLDLFVTADISGTGVITVTPQLSADGANWADATYSYLGTPIAYVTTVTATTTSTSTATVTNTVTASGVPTHYTQPYRLVLQADGTEYLTLPMVGYYLRVQIGYSGTITPVIRVVGRND